MFTFLVRRGWRWEFELRAVPVRRSEPELQGGMYESLMAEVGGWNPSDQTTSDDNQCADRDRG